MFCPKVTLDIINGKSGMGADHHHKVMPKLLDIDIRLSGYDTMTHGF